MKIIYIAGYGRSGSTLVDIILSNRSTTFGLGEIANLPRRSQSPRYLPIWNNCIKYLNSKFSAAELENLSACEYNLLAKYDRLKYKKFWCELYNFIHQHYPGYIDVFIDSSKTAWKTLLRPKRLHQSGFEVYIIHLKRNSKDTIASTLKGSNKSIENKRGYKKDYLFATKSAVSCWLVNLLTRLLYNKKKYHYKVMHYENLIKNPALFIEEVYMFCGVDYLRDEKYLERIKSNSYDSGIAFEGNRMRVQSNCIKIKNEQIIK